MPSMEHEIPHHDVIVVGAGMGGIYAVQRFKQDGLSVLGLEGGGGFGGVWYHNRYPGARVDIESLDYCFHFSRKIYNEWVWSERYATQAELLAYLNYVADECGIRDDFRFDTWLTAARWRPESQSYLLTTSTGANFTCQFLVMATGNLSIARNPPFAGLDMFRGQWVQTSHWPDRPVDIHDRRIGVIGTGSSGVQTIPVLAQHAAHLYVFQRSPNFSVPAWNGPIDAAAYADRKARVEEYREQLLDTPGGAMMKAGERPASEMSDSERQTTLDQAWARGGQLLGRVFSDQLTDPDVNELVSSYVRAKIRSKVHDPRIAEKLCPYDHPIGTRRICVDTGYYETYNRENVTLVDIRESPIERITETGIRTADGHYELDLIVFALGFHAFKGAIEAVDIRNEYGKRPTDDWKRGPRTLLGLMTRGFPNLFIATGPGSPSVLSTMTTINEFHMDWIADCLAFMRARNFSTVEPTLAGQDAWTRHVADVAAGIWRRQVDNYMVQVNADGSRVFLPYVGGMNRYVPQAREIAQQGYRGFEFDGGVACSIGPAAAEA